MAGDWRESTAALDISLGTTLEVRSDSSDVGLRVFVLIMELGVVRRAARRL